MGDSSDKLSAGKKKITVENYIYSVVGLEASNLVPLVSLEGGKSNFIFLFQHRQMMSHYQRESPDMSGVLAQLQQGCGCRSEVLLGQMLRLLLAMPRVLTSDLPPSPKSHLFKNTKPRYQPHRSCGWEVWNTSS